MGKLKIGVEVRDFDLERMGFSLSVLGESKKAQSSEAYLRMSLPELNIFLKALKAAPDEIEVCAVDSLAGSRIRALGAERPDQPNRAGRMSAGRGVPLSLEEMNANFSMRAAE
jgi:hypothetical protein